MAETPSAAGKDLLRALLKSSPGDFRVNEVMDIDFEGSGEHLYLHIEKTGTNTDEVVTVLEKALAVESQDIGVSGLKDRHAITRQWFSVRTAASTETVEKMLAEFNLACHDKALRLLNSARHSRKLRRGAHRGNDFRIVLRDVTLVDSARTDVDARIAALAVTGFPNYIGPQRFGHGAQNLVRARQWFRQPKKRTSRQQRSLWLSAARSALFNEVCAARVRTGQWQQLLPGEPAVLDGSRSFFDSSAATAQELTSRLAAFDIHPSGPWWGRGKTPAHGDCAAFEQEVLAGHVDLCAGLERAGLPQERRALRALAQSLAHRWLDDDSLELRFRLSPGVFATTLLRELGECVEPERKTAPSPVGAEKGSDDQQTD